MVKVFLLAALCTFVVTPAVGATSNGQFHIAGGVGGVTCPEFVAAMESARSKGIGSVAYVTEVQGYEMYVLGFETGYNMARPSTYDIFPTHGSKYPLLSWVENWCRTHSTAHFGEGVVALARDRYFARQQALPATH